LSIKDGKLSHNSFFTENPSHSTVGSKAFLCFIHCHNLMLCKNKLKRKNS